MRSGPHILICLLVAACTPLRSESLPDGGGDAPGADRTSETAGDLAPAGPADSAAVPDVHGPADTLADGPADTAADGPVTVPEVAADVFECGPGEKRCGTRCAACCEHTDCGPCRKCEAGVCRPQSSDEDVKDDCAEGTCRTGRCDGNGACGNVPSGGNGPGCTGECRRCRDGSCEPRTGSCGNPAASCVNDGAAVRAGDSCQAGECRPGAVTACGYKGCAGGQCRSECPEGTYDAANACVPCGGRNQYCCAGGRCNPGHACENLFCVCGTIHTPCCPGPPGQPGVCDDGQSFCNFENMCSR